MILQPAACLVYFLDSAALRYAKNLKPIFLLTKHHRCYTCMTISDQDPPLFYSAAVLVISFNWVGGTHLPTWLEPSKEVLATENNGEETHLTIFFKQMINKPIQTKSFH